MKKQVKITVDSAEEAHTLLRIWRNDEAELVKQLQKKREKIKALVEQFGEENGEPTTQEKKAVAAATNRSESVTKSSVDTGDDSKGSTYFNWKGAARKLIIEGDEVLSSELLYEINKSHFDEVGITRVSAIRNFSSSLYYLRNAGTVVRVIIPNAKAHLYGAPHCFDGDMIKEEYKEKLRKRGVRI